MLVCFLKKASLLLFHTIFHAPLNDVTTTEVDVQGFTYKVNIHC